MNRKKIRKCKMERKYRFRIFAVLLLFGMLMPGNRAEYTAAAEADSFQIEQIEEVTGAEMEYKALQGEAEAEILLPQNGTKTETVPLQSSAGSKGASLQGGTEAETDPPQSETNIEEVTEQETNPPQSESNIEEVTEQETDPPQREAESKVHLGIDNRHCYAGMSQTFSDGYEPDVQDGIVSLVIPFTADGALRNDRITVDLVFPEKADSPFVLKNEQKDVAGKWYEPKDGRMIESSDQSAEQTPDPVNQAGKKAYLYQCKIALADSAAPGQYSVTVKAAGYSLSGEKTELDYQIFIQIPEPEAGPDQGTAGGGDAGGGSFGGGGAGAEAAEEIIHQPKMLLDTCSISGKSISAGTTEPIEATFQNRSVSQAMYNLKITAASDSKSIHPLKNSWYFSEVGPGEKIEIDTRLQIGQTVDDAAAALNFDFEYEDKKGTAASGKESIPISIVQPTSMQLEMTAIPAVLYATDTAELSFQALNLSRTGIYNARICLSGTGLFPNEEVFLGNMDAGSEGGGTMHVYVGTRTMQEIGTDPGSSDAEKYGPVSGTVTLSYEDAAGETHTVTKEYESEIRKAELLSLKVEEQPEANSWWISVFVSVIALLIVLVLTLLFQLHRKNVILGETKSQGKNM